MYSMQLLIAGGLPHGNEDCCRPSSSPTDGWHVTFSSCPLGGSPSKTGLWLSRLPVGPHLGQLPAHYGCHPGHVWHGPVSFQIPHICKYTPSCSSISTPSSWDGGYGIWWPPPFSVWSMAGPLGGLELIHYLLLFGGWQPVTGSLYFYIGCTHYLMCTCTLVFCFN